MHAYICARMQSTVDMKCLSNVCEGERSRVCVCECARERLHIEIDRNVCQHVSLYYLLSQSPFEGVGIIKNTERP